MKYPGILLPAALLTILNTAAFAQQQPDIKTRRTAIYNVELQLDRFGVFPLSYEGIMYSDKVLQGERVDIRIHRKPDGVRLLVPEGIDPDPQIEAESINVLIQNGFDADDEIAAALSGRINIMMLPLLINGIIDTKNIPHHFTVVKQPGQGTAVNWDITFMRNKNEQLQFTGTRFSDTGLWLFWEAVFIRNGKKFNAGGALLQNWEYTDE